MPSEVNASDIDVLALVAGVEDVNICRAIEALAHEKAENARLKADQTWLERRIAEEDARLAHAR